MGQKKIDNENLVHGSTVVSNAVQGLTPTELFVNLSTAQAHLVLRGGLLLAQDSKGDVFPVEQSFVGMLLSFRIVVTY